MKNTNRMKRMFSGFLTVLLMLTAVPVSAWGTETDGSRTVQDGTSPLAAYFDESQVNPDYIEWMKNGRKGRAPSANDLSYLGASYAKLRARKNRSLLSVTPATYDLRDYGLVEPVPNQGQLGVCWAIAANSAAAGPLLKQFPQTSFSPIHTAWFARSGEQEEEAYPMKDHPYDGGGVDGIAVAVMAAWEGPVFSDKAPMVPDNQEDPNEALRYEAEYHLQDAYYMPVGIYVNKALNLRVSDEITKQLLMDVGPITINYYASGENTYNEETSAWYNSENSSSDHAVLLIGWDDAYSKENFCQGNQPENDGAWLIRNSWDTDWGDDGYFWLSYEDKSIESGNAYLLEEKNNYAKNYQHDITGWAYSLGISDDSEQAKTVTAANIFTAEGNEMLEAVSFYTTDAGTEYSISIYTGVEEGKPESGTLALEKQTGRELYAGYHTIELNQPVKLEKGKRFSIVVTLTNPEYTAPLAIEWYVKASPDDVPKYLGSGGESYIYCPDKDSKWTWEDVAGDISDEFYVTNVCIKGFTNPLPKDGEAVSTVRFSEMEGPVKDGAKLALHTEGNEKIYYSLDRKNYEEYTAPLTLNFAKGTSKHTVSAYAVDSNENKGNTVTKTYCQAEAQLTNLAVAETNGSISIDTAQTEHEVYVHNNAENIKIMAQSSDTITVNGKPLKSGGWSDEIPLNSGETKTITVKVTGEGKTPSTYTLKIYRSMLAFDYAAETIKFDGTKYTVTDTKGNEVKNGDSVASLIKDGEVTELRITPKSGGDSFKDCIPGRLILSGVKVDYLYESTNTAFSDVYAYSNHADMSEKVQCKSGEFIPIEPGMDVYIQRQPTDKDFAGTIFHLEVPERPAAPKVEAAEITETCVTLKEIEGAMYSCDDSDWQESPKFTDLTQGTEYLFMAYLPATDTSFCSEIGRTNIITSGAWYYEAVQFVQENGLMNGYSNGRFGPNDPLSRAQLAQILFNKEGRPGVNDLLDFSDVSGEAWYAEAVRWAANQGIVSGYGNGKFGPNDPITREQLAVMLWRYSDSPAAAEKELNFTDTDKISDYAQEALRWAVENGVLNGYGNGRLDPQGQATRAQVAQMLKNLMENQEENAVQ